MRDKVKGHATAAAACDYAGGEQCLVVVKVGSVGEPNEPCEAEMALQCEQCWTKFTDPSQLCSHLYTHREYFLHSCDPCNKYFTVDKA